MPLKYIEHFRSPSRDDHARDNHAESVRWNHSSSVRGLADPGLLDTRDHLPFRWQGQPRGSRPALDDRPVLGVPQLSYASAGTVCPHRATTGLTAIGTGKVCTCRSYRERPQCNPARVTRHRPVAVSRSPRRLDAAATPGHRSTPERRHRSTARHTASPHRADGWRQVRR